MKKEPQFNYLIDITNFSLGFTIAKPHKATGWKYYISLDIAFISVWMYF